MKNEIKKTFRCAIYTRKSTEHGLELEFNSLDAQREACEAYIQSQTSVGWKLLPRRYDDPAYSGGSLVRPALQRLLKDIEAGEIDVVVVYKIDRLTRSLSDFAKVVEIFDSKSISFVAVTQQFNTTTSMGRLTLNVLLSFAQFERELSSERVRDKVAASRKKGKWMGGNVPLGYRVVDKKLLIESSEAKNVQYIFRRYLEVKTLQNLISDLAEKKIITRKRLLRKNSPVGGKSLTFGPLAYLLKNRIYTGEVGHKGVWFPGEHEPIVKDKLFKAVQEQLKVNSVVRRQKRTASSALLTGILFDDRGNRMTPSYTTKRGVRYRFYVNSILLSGRSGIMGAVRRVSALRLESAVSNALRRKFPEKAESLSDTELAMNAIQKIILRKGKMTIELKIPWLLRSRVKINTFDVALPSKPSSLATLESSDRDTSGKQNIKLIHAVARSNMWLKILADRKFKTIEGLAESLKLCPRGVRNSLRMAFLAPDIVDAILNGRRLMETNAAKLQSQLPLSWAEQRRIMAFAKAP